MALETLAQIRLSDQRVLRLQEGRVPSSYRHTPHQLRIVECAPSQTGYLLERGVRVLWGSDSYDPRRRGPRSTRASALVDARKEWADMCLAALCVQTGLRADAPIEAILDRAEDLDVSLDEFTREVLKQHSQPVTVLPSTS